MSRSPRDPTGRIAAAFAGARQEGRPALIPYLVAGDPDLASTRSLVLALGRGGADIVELGVPFSDPIADGPVIQRSVERALRNGVTLRDALTLAAELRRAGAPPLVLFTYYNPVHRLGCAAFAEESRQAGIDGVIVTDLPVEEGEELDAELRPRGIDLIPLLAPTSSRERVERIGRAARGFLYFVSRAGVTGAREDLPDDLETRVRSVRAVTTLPVAVGFGISGPEHVRSVGRYADGVVVGSALVRLVEEAEDTLDRPGLAEAFVRGLRAASTPSPGIS
jgi:tryptophan synthase alpha chain